MRDIELLYQDSNDNLQLGLNGQDLSFTEDPSTRLIQKIILLLNQAPNSNSFYPDGFSLRTLMNQKLSADKEAELKVKIKLYFTNLQNTIIAEQEVSNLTDDPATLLQEITIVDIIQETNGWHIELVVYDTAGGKTYLKV